MVHGLYIKLIGQSDDTFAEPMMLYALCKLIQNTLGYVCEGEVKEGPLKLLFQTHHDKDHSNVLQLAELYATHANTRGHRYTQLKDA